MITRSTLLLFFSAVGLSCISVAQDAQPAVGTKPSSTIAEAGTKESSGELGQNSGEEASGAALEGGWGAYDATPLSVKRSITVERDGEVYQAHVYTPVLTRRGALFLTADQVSEMHSIKEEIRLIGEEVVRLREKAAALGRRYKELTQNSKAGMLETYAAQNHSGRVEFVDREEN